MESQRRLTARALAHARLGACRTQPGLCPQTGQGFEAFEAQLSALGPRDLDAAFVLATSWAAWIAAHSEDFNALADLPRVEALLEWIGEREPAYEDGAVWLYLGVLNSQRPPAAGGRPALAREYFERARALSEGRNLLIGVLMADHYARLLFDRELFVELLEAVLVSEPRQPGFVLTNYVAQARARELLQQTERIFD